MKVLAFDPGFERLGAAVVEKNERGIDILVHSECVRTSAALTFPTRLLKLGETCESLIERYEPGCLALEKLYFENNAKTAMQVAEVMGVLTYLAARHKLPVYEYTPLEVKVAITGYGKSDKVGVASMVPRLLRLPARKRLDDELDAIAVGLTCLASVHYPHALRQK